LATAVAMFMKNNGYNLIERIVINAIFEKGNRTTKLLFGAFVKYFKFNVKVENCRVHFSSGNSRFSGGVIGIGQVKKEAKEIAGGLKGL
jgi:hypothetical protein